MNHVDRPQALARADGPTVARRVVPRAACCWPLRHAIAALTLLATVAALAGPAAAQTEEPPADKRARIEQLAVEAQTLYGEGKYAEAVGRYLEAYRLQPTAALLYNIAYVYDRALDDVDLAIDYYRRFVRDPAAEPKLVERALSRINVLKLRQADAEGPRDEDPKPAPEPAPEPPAAPIDPMPWALIGGGSALAISGAVLMGIASGTHSDFQKAQTAADKQRYKDAAQAQAIAGDVLLGVGVAAAAAGVLVFLLVDGDSESPSSSSDEEGVSLRFGASPLAGGGMLSLSGSL